MGPSSIEDLCEQLVELGLGATVRHIDGDGRQGSVDAEILFADGRRGVLEVTTVGDEEWRESESLAERFNEADALAGSVKRRWELFVAPGSRFDRIEPLILPALNELEAEGLLLLRNELSPRSRRDFDNRVAAIGPQRLANALELASLGVHIYGFPDESEQPATVRIIVDSGGGGVVGAVNELVAWINVELLGSPRVQTKIDKLREASAVERHLAVLPFVPPENVTVMYHLGIGSYALPTIDPICDPCIDGLWLISGRTATWWERGRGWNRVVYPGEWRSRGQVFVGE